MVNTYIKRINQVYPKLTIREYEKNDIGQNNDVLIINTNLVFRFPKYKDGISILKEETRILSCIKSKVSLTVPSPIYLSFDQMDVGQAFTGYELIPGSPLWKEKLYKIKNKGSVKNIAVQLVNFLKELHSIPKDRCYPNFEQMENNPQKDMIVLFEKIKSKIYPLISDKHKKQITKSFKEFLESPSFLNLETTLIHGDFGASNIIYNPVESEVSGIIDFGGSGVGDPAYDFAGLLSSYGEAFYNMCLELYPSGKEISKRVTFYKSTFALQEALHGIENNDPEAFESGIKDYR
ncbi:phosphotransferase family protein [Haloplasma contractile]|uniref:Phospholipiddiacylglycerol acyltransferase protein n=1 Tax=Haloplasma contractile SSD-17B TaxID=1033810 RepID=U2EEW6_9MOLU|nr:aminoglycoside phosphotransferase family protein [Haloplasma contractile]ERJ13236.1 phospholipiddiacylglycerol acyltransferase protein [Haloplasma contractile SSD-17B]